MHCGFSCASYSVLLLPYLLLPSSVYESGELMGIFTEAKQKYFSNYATSIMVPSAGSQGGQFFQGVYDNYFDFLHSGTFYSCTYVCLCSRVCSANVPSQLHTDIHNTLLQVVLWNRVDLQIGRVVRNDSRILTLLLILHVQR